MVLAGLACVVYVPFLANPLVFDDFNVVNAADFIDYAFRFSIAPRWLPYATLVHNNLLTNGSIPAMRLGNLILHAANVVAVFVLLREIFMATVDDRLGHPEDCNSRALVVASLGAALLAVHPVAVYGVGYLVQRTILMSTLFMLLMLITYLRWLISGRSALWVWSALWYLLSVFSKEHSVAAPAVALLLTLVLQRPSPALARRLIAPFTAYLVIALLAISMVKGFLGTAYEPYALDMIKDMHDIGDERLRNAYPLSVITQSYLYFKYLFLWLMPNVDWMSVDMREPLASSLVAWPYWAAALAFIGYPVLATGMALRGGRVGMAGWVLAFPWLMFATELSTVRVQEPFVLYRAYLWFPVFGALAPLALVRMNTKVVAVLAAPVLCVLVALSWNRLNTQSDTLLLWEDAARFLVTGHEPGAGRIYYNRALALSAKGRKTEALADLDRVVRLHPKLAPVYNARARTNFDLKRYSQTLQDLNMSITLDPRNSAAYFGRAITLKRLGREDEAIPDLQKSCEMKNVIGCYALQQSVKNGTPPPR